MALDPRIPLYGLNRQPNGGSVGDTMLQNQQRQNMYTQNQGMQQEQQINQYKLEQQQQVQAMGAGADLTTPEGQQSFLKSYQGVDPVGAVDLSGKFANIAKTKQEAAAAQQDAMATAVWGVRGAFEDRMLQNGGDPVEASKYVTPIYQSTVEQMVKGGLLPKEQLQKMPADFNQDVYNQILPMSMSPAGIKIWQERQKAQHERDQFSETKRHNRATEANAGLPSKEQESFGQPQYEIVDGKTIAVQYGNRGARRVVADAGVPASKNDQSSDDERKSAFLLQRLQNAQKDIESKLGSQKPELLAEGIRGVPLMPEAAANAMTSSDRQIVEGAQLDALDAALTLATGAAYTKDQLRSLTKAYFPQIGDDPPTVESKKARYDNLIESAKVRAGRSMRPEPKAPPTAPGDTRPPLGSFNLP